MSASFLSEPGFEIKNQESRIKKSTVLMPFDIPRMILNVQGRRLSPIAQS